MKEEYWGGLGSRVEIEDDRLFIKSNLAKERCFLPHIEYTYLRNVNFQNRGVLKIVTDSRTSLDIVFIGERYEKMKDLYKILLHYMQRIIFDHDARKITIYNKGNDDPVEKPFNKVNVSNPYTYLSFDEIIGYDIIGDNKIIDNKTIMTISSGKQSANNLETLIDAIISMTSNTYMSNLQIQFNINNTEKPYVYANYITRKTDLNSRMAMDLITMCAEDLTILNMIFKKDVPVDESIYEYPSDTNDPFTEVKKLKELLDMGILTQEEFDRKKKELLNL